MDGPSRGSVGGGLGALDWLAPVLVNLFLLHLVGWGMAFEATVPAVSDLTGHFSAIEVLRTRLLPDGTFRGWAPEWFAGFPAYYFYFPLPGLAAALLGSVVPPPTAVRMVALAAPLALPWVLWAFARWAGLSRAGVISVVLFGGIYLTSGSTILGGNLGSTIAGEFSYGWSLAFAILFLGQITRMPVGARRTISAGLLLAASILSHVLPALAAIVASSVLIFSPGRRRPLLLAWATAAGLSAVWTVPMLARLPFAADLGWRWEPGWSDFLPLHLLLILPAALMGLRALPRSLALQVLAVAGLFGALMAVAPQTLVMRARLLPVYLLTLHVLAGVGVAEALRLARRPRPALGIAALALAVVPPVLAVSARGTTELQRFAALALVGIDSKPGAAELEALEEHLAGLPPGRLHWEHDEELYRWGGSYALADLARTTPHSALTGLLKESAPISTVVAPIDDLLAASPPSRPEWWWARSGEAWDPVRAVELLRGLGVRYLVTVSEPTTEALAEHLQGPPPEQIGSLTLFDLGPAPHVLPTCLYAREPSEHGRSPGEDWLESWRAGAAWPTDEPALATAPCPGPDPAAVSHVEIAPERIEFRTRATGVPHLVRTSHFPNWTASGADGPFRAGPGFMVVVPTDEVVVLEFATTWVERLAWAIALLSAALLIVVATGGRSLRAWVGDSGRGGPFGPLRHSEEGTPASSGRANPHSRGGALSTIQE